MNLLKSYTRRSRVSQSPEQNTPTSGTLDTYSTTMLNNEMNWGNNKRSISIYLPILKANVEIKLSWPAHSLTRTQSTSYSRHASWDWLQGCADVCCMCVCVLIKCVSGGGSLNPPTHLKSSKGVIVTLGQLTHVHTPALCTNVHSERCIKIHRTPARINKPISAYIYYTHTHMHACTLCKCIVLVEDVSRRAAECKWGERGGVNVCGPCVWPFVLFRTTELLHKSLHIKCAAHLP